MSSSRQTSQVEKRGGHKEDISFDKILRRISALASGLDVDVMTVCQGVIAGMYDGVKTILLDELAAETAAGMSATHGDYARLAGRIACSNLQKMAPSTLRGMWEMVMDGEEKPVLDEECFRVIVEHGDALQEAMVADRDMNFDYFGFKTLEKSYLIKKHDRTIETPQFMYMRIAVAIHLWDLSKVIEVYHALSTGMYSHATPTMFHAGTICPQMSSCFLLTLREDSIKGIFETLSQCALISKHAGGIGLNVHDLRGRGSLIQTTQGRSNGIVPFLRIFSETSRSVDQGGGKRKGSFAIYLEPWHTDIFDWLDLKKNHGKEESRARDLFYGLWIPDLFMKRVQEDSTWTLFCPSVAKGLSDVWGDLFERMYVDYEEKGVGTTVQARSLWYKILDSQIETGTPYLLFKDACNAKSNQRHLGTIRNSNLCTEVVQYCSRDEIAVCNLASVCLPKYVCDDPSKPGGKWIDHGQLRDMVHQLVDNLNRVIDKNLYPLEETRTSNLRHRPMGIGVQGLADVFIMCDLAFESDSAKTLNREIFETMYFAALTKSMQLAKVDGAHESFPGSPLCEGLFQFDLWEDPDAPSSALGYDWEGLRQNIRDHGVRNSLLLAPMPTASTAQILGNNECFEPYTSNIFVRRVLAGEFIVVNRHLVEDLKRLGKWTSATREQLMKDNGSVQNMDLSKHLKDKYKTVWEISQKTVIDMAADRGRFIDQSQSMNLFLPDPDLSQLTSMHFHSWKQGLKTGMYYLRTRPAADPIQFTVPVAPMCSKRPSSGGDEDECLVCSA